MTDDRRSRARQLREQRRAMRQWARLRAIEDTIGSLAGPSAAPVGRSSKTSESTTVLPPGADVLELAYAHPGEVARLFRDIHARIERLEDLIDAHLGRGGQKDYAAMSGHEKNAAILTEFVGWRPEDVVALAPEFGTAKTIRYVRTVWAADPENHWPGGAVRGTCGHREGHCTDGCGRPRDDRYAARKLTPGQADEIRRRAAEGETQASLAREFGVDPSRVSQLARAGT